MNILSALSYRLIELSIGETAVLFSKCNARKIKWSFAYDNQVVILELESDCTRVDVDSLTCSSLSASWFSQLGFRYSLKKSLDADALQVVKYCILFFKPP